MKAYEPEAFMTTSTTLQFQTLRQMIHFVRASLVRNYEMNTTANMLIANLSEVQIQLAITFGAAVVATAG